MTPPIIGFIGPMRSGKTALSDGLVDLPRHTHLRVMHFADPIKACLRSIGVTKEVTPPLFRALAQTVGQTCRNSDPNWWVNRFDVQYSEETRRSSGEVGIEPVTLIDDVRYANEIEWVRGRGGELVFVDAWDRVDLTEEFRQHESELIANILHAELAEAHHIRPAVQTVHSPYLGTDITVVRNVDGFLDDAAYLLAQHFGL